MSDYWSRDREQRFSRIEAEAAGFGLKIREADARKRPWGGYVRFTRDSLPAFRRAYWRRWISPYWRSEIAKLWRQHIQRPELPLDAKLLLLEPGKRFSLQAHQRRDEFWRVIEGPVLVVIGEDEDNLRTLQLGAGEVIRIRAGQLHRAAAPALHWGVIAEFWRHTDPNNPSDEKEDIIHYADDYRKVVSKPRRRSPRA